MANGYDALTRDQKNVLRHLPADGETTFKVPPPPKFAGLPDEVWHMSEACLNTETRTYSVTFWSDNGESFVFDTGSPY